MPLLLVAGPSGVGKSTVIELLVERHSFNSVSIDVCREEGTRIGPGKNLVSQPQFNSNAEDGDYFHIYKWAESVYGVSAKDIVRSQQTDDWWAFEYPGDYPRCLEFAHVSRLAGVIIVTDSGQVFRSRLSKRGSGKRVKEAVHELQECKRVIDNGLPTNWFSLVNRDGGIDETIACIWKYCDEQNTKQ